MNVKDQLKIINAGFRIIRADEQNLRIKEKSFVGMEWRTFEKGFASKAALGRRVRELLESNKIIEG